MPNCLHISRIAGVPESEGGIKLRTEEEKMIRGGVEVKQSRIFERTCVLKVATLKSFEERKSRNRGSNCRQEEGWRGAV